MSTPRVMIEPWAMGLQLAWPHAADAAPFRSDFSTHTFRIQARKNGWVHALCIGPVPALDRLELVRVQVGDQLYVEAQGDAGGVWVRSLCDGRGRIPMRIRVLVGQGITVMLRVMHRGLDPTMVGANLLVQPVDLQPLVGFELPQELDQLAHPIAEHLASIAVSMTHAENISIAVGSIVELIEEEKLK